MRPPSGPGPGPGSLPEPPGLLGSFFHGFCTAISSCVYVVCCCWLFQDCFGGPLEPPAGGPPVPAPAPAPPPPPAPAPAPPPPGRVDFGPLPPGSPGPSGDPPGPPDFGPLPPGPPGPPGQPEPPPF